MPINYEAAKTLIKGLVQKMKSFRGNWEQNDPTADDYIKNRPFYTGDPVETVLVEESTMSFSENDGLYITRFSATFEATVGDTYKVSWDGTTYECTCADVDGVAAIGNPSIPGVGADTGEPFIIAVDRSDVFTIYTTDASASHTFSISGIVQEVVKLDEKYIPSTIQRVGDDVIIPSSTSDSDKKFKITVDDSGKPTFTNSSDSADSYTPTDLPPVTASDSGKFLRVSSAGEWIAETIPNASGVSF